MSCGNPFNHLIPNIKESMIEPEHEFRNDEEMECLLYGFCSKPESNQKPRRVIL
tara:strand:- start:596 stop:757 length:162 start_codon:yes stop_codon:yes gene_type:complete